MRFAYPVVFAAVSAVLLTAVPAPAIDYAWKTAADGNWNLNTNWTPTGVPNATTDNAALTVAGTYTVFLTDDRTVNNLTVSASGATLAQSSNLTISSTGAFNLTAGTYALSAGTLNVIGSLDFSTGTTLNWTGGSIGSTSNGPMLLEGTTAVTSSTLKSIFGTTLQNAGTLRWSAGAITPGANPTAMTNLTGALLDFRNDGTAFGANGNAATLINRGTIRKSAGEASNTTVAWAVDLRGGGTVDAQIGVLNFSGGGTLNSGTTTFTNTGALGGGTVNLTGGTFVVPNNATFTAAPANGVTLNWAGATLSGGGASGTIAGVLTVTGGNCYVSGTTLTAAGTINWQAGRIFPATNPTALTNAASGLIDFQADGTAFEGNGNPATLINAGTLRKSVGSNVSATAVNWAVDFRNGGQVQANTGALNFNGGGTLSSGTTTFSSTGGGAAYLAGGTFTVNAGDTFTAQPTGAATLNWAGATIGGGGTLAGTVTVTGGNCYVSGTTLTAAGTINWQAGRIFPATNPTALTNAASGLIDFQADGTAFEGNGNPATLINAGTLRKSAGTASSTIINWQLDFRDGGKVQANVGSLLLNGGGTLSSGTTTFSSTGGGAAYLTGGTFVVPNNATFTAAPANGVTLNWAGATLAAGSLGGTLAGTVTVTGGNCYVSGTTLTAAGTINWQAGRIFPATNPTALTNAASGLIDFQADGTAFEGNGNPATLINAGTLRKSAGTASSTIINWGVTNSGNINGNVGTLAFGGGVTNTGTVTVANAATISGAITSNVGGMVRSAPAAVATDVATYGGPLVFNSSSTFAPGGVGGTGLLQMNGNLTMASGATLHLDLNGTTAVTGYDRVKMGGGLTTTLGTATLDARTGSGFNPTATDKLFVLTGSTTALVGTFNGLGQNGFGTARDVNGNPTWSYQVSYTGSLTNNAITGGNDIVLYNFSPVPEPGAVLAVATGALGAIGLVRRRRRTV